MIKLCLSIINNDKMIKNGSKSKDDKSEIKAQEKFILSITENGFGKKHLILTIGLQIVLKE